MNNSIKTTPKWRECPMGSKMYGTSLFDVVDFGMIVRWFLGSRDK
jgi:hypothetical protein